MRRIRSGWRGGRQSVSVWRHGGAGVCLRLARLALIAGLVGGCAAPDGALNLTGAAAPQEEPVATAPQILVRTRLDPKTTVAAREVFIRTVTASPVASLLNRGPAGLKPLGTVELVMDATPAEFQTALAATGFSPGASAFYLPRGSAAGLPRIELAWVRTGGQAPEALLAHEAVHHLLRERVDRVFAARAGLPPELEALPVCTPFWLNEGLATCMEGLLVRRSRPPPVWDPAAVQPNWPRYGELRGLFRAQREGGLVALALARPNHQDLPSGNYALAWGLTYDLAVMGDPGRRAALDRYIELCRNGFYPESQAGKFRAEFLDADGKFTTEACRRWNERIARLGAAEFAALFAGAGGLDAWETAWRERLKDRSRVIAAGQPR